MIRPVGIHSIFEKSIDSSAFEDKISPSEWLAKKALFKDYLNSLSIKDNHLYERLLEEFNDGLLFNIEFKFLMYDLGFSEESIDEIIKRFDAGEKPYGTNEKYLDQLIPDKVSYQKKLSNCTLTVDPNFVVNLLLTTPSLNYDSQEEIKRGR